MIYKEYVNTEKYLFQLSGKNELMAEYAIEQQSIGMREKIVLPLVTIQQFAISSIREMEKELVTMRKRYLRKTGNALLFWNY